jgi:predicted homoserine dehydrogenase-like protein
MKGQILEMLVGRQREGRPLRVGLRGEATGSACGFLGDVGAGEILDGESAARVCGKLMPAQASLKRKALPIGLAHRVTLDRGVKAGEAVCWPDVKVDENEAVVRFRREMAEKFREKEEPEK